MLPGKNPDFRVDQSLTVVQYVLHIIAKRKRADRVLRVLLGGVAT